MHDTFSVRTRQSLGNFRDNRQNFWKRQFLGAYRFLQRFAGNVLHRDEDFALDLRYFVNAANVGMGQRRGRPGFLEKTLSRCRIQFEQGGGKFESNPAIEARVESEPYFAHTAFTEFLDDFVPAENFSNHSGAKE